MAVEAGIRQLEGSWARGSTRTFGCWISICPPRRPDLSPPALALHTAASLGQGSVQSISLDLAPF